MTTSQGPGGAVNYDVQGANGSHVKVTSGGGSAAALPAFLPMYPGATVTTSMVGGDANGGGGMVMLAVKAKPEDVINFYKLKATAAGFATASRRSRTRRFSTPIASSRSSSATTSGTHRSSSPTSAGARSTTSSRSRAHGGRVASRHSTTRTAGNRS